MASRVSPGDKGRRVMGLSGHRRTKPTHNWRQPTFESATEVFVLYVCQSWTALRLNVNGV